MKFKIKYLILCCSCFFSFFSYAQNISGKWVSPIEDDNSNVVLQLQQNGDIITGIGYKQFGDSIGSAVALINGTFRNYLLEYNTKSIVEQKVDSTYSLCFVHGRDLLYIRKNKMMLKGVAHSIDYKEECKGLSGKEKYTKVNSYNYSTSLFKERKVLVTDTITIEKDSIQIHVYDHLQEDGDIISLYLNEQPVLQSYTLKHAHKIITVSVSQLENELIVYAHNLGSIPPNTVAIEIWQNNKLLKKVILQSDMEKSESIVFKRKIK